MVEKADPRCAYCGSPHVYFRTVSQHDKRRRYLGEVRVLFNEDGGKHHCRPQPPEHNDA